MVGQMRQLSAAFAATRCRWPRLLAHTPRRWLDVPMWTMFALPALVGVAKGQTSGTAGPVFGEATLPRDLSPWGMFTSADIVVKAVIVGLAFASIVTWTVWLAKTIELLVSRRR